jgi:hypothetical protein
MSFDGFNVTGENRKSVRFFGSSIRFLMEGFPVGPRVMDIGGVLLVLS